jgi:dimethylargininase
MKAKRALVREPGRGFSRCISTHPMRHTIDVERARRQHSAYVDTLKALGLDIIRLGRDDSLPDSCFVEDTAVVHGARALICRPAKDTRRGETEAVGAALEQHLEVRAAAEPATVEGGDVLHVGGRLICGLTKRTNAEGARQLSAWLGAQVDTIDDPSIMHLKSYVSHIDEGRVLVTRGFAHQPALEGLEKLVVPDGEEYAANVLSVDGTVVMPKGYHATKALLERSGVEVVALEMTEFPKCDGAMTCLSILF